MHRENLIEEIDPLQEKVVDAIMQVKKGLGESKITADTIHIIIKQVMELVEKFSIPGKDTGVEPVAIIVLSAPIRVSLFLSSFIKISFLD